MNVKVSVQEFLQEGSSVETGTPAELLWYRSVVTLMPDLITEIEKVIQTGNLPIKCWAYKVNGECAETLRDRLNLTLPQAYRRLIELKVQTYSS